MNSIASPTTVGQLVAEQPNRSRLFEELGIDYCCGGKRTLDEACASRGLRLDDVLSRLEELKPANTSSPGTDYNAMPLEKLTENIIATHHEYLRQELPRLGRMAEKVAQVHGEHDPRLVQLARVYYAFVQELAAHMMKEEQILFPAICTLSAGQPLTGCCFATIAAPINAMEAEHDQAGGGLARMRELTDGFTPPDWACNTYRALLDGLKELELDMHQHIHKENNILFPKALALEAQLA